ncbi:MAG: phage terminase large subunit [Bacteroidales bacterium]|nr:phage terminase large subunit [Bacteroidales bacterium]
MIAPYGISPTTHEANKPNPTQQKVLEWFDFQRAIPLKDRTNIPVLYLQGGVGSGKTRAIMAAAMECLCEIPSLRVLWGRQDFKDLKLSVMDKFFEILPSELVGAKNQQYNWWDIRQNGGGFSRIYFNGLKDIGGLGSQEFGLIIVTEAHEMSYQSYAALKRRCRQENVINIIVMESESPNEDHWLAEINDKESEMYDPDVECWEVSTYENWENLPKSYTGSLDNMPEAWKKKYLLGKRGFIPDGKPFYRGFNYKFNTGEFEAVQGVPLDCGWDFGFHHPAFLVTQMDRQDRWILLRELLGYDLTIDKFCEQVKTFLNTYFPGMQCNHYGDPACTQVNDKSEMTSKQICASHNFGIMHRPSQYRARKEIIEKRLATLNGDKPQLLVDSRYCTNLTDGFLGGYHYPNRKQGQQMGSNQEMPFKDGYYDHMMNAMEYIAVNKFSPIDIRRPQNPRKKRRAIVDNI